MESCEAVRIYRGKEDMTRFKVRDTYAGLQEKIEKLKRMQHEINEMQAKINQYHFKGRKNKAI
jgi:uncharacterized membrane protein (DUF106 family)